MKNKFWVELAVTVGILSCSITLSRILVEMQRHNAVMEAIAKEVRK